MQMTRIGLWLVVLWIGAAAHAAEPAEHVAAAPAPHGADEAAIHSSRPALSDPSPMAGLMLIVIAGMFFAAAIVGPVVRYHAPEEPPEPSPHDAHGHAGHLPHGH